MLGNSPENRCAPDEAMSRKSLFLTALLAFWAACVGRAQTATNITGLYYSGMTGTGGLIPQPANGARDPHWNVTYASINGGSSTNATYMGAAYVINSANIAADHVANTSTAQWITAPGARDSNNANPNTGGDYLPGTGTGTNEGIFVYTLAFQIAGNGNPGTLSTSNISISLTIAADDQFAIYVNPAGNGTTVPTGTAAFSRTVISPYVNDGTEPWQNTVAATLNNGTDHTGTSGNARFVIGTNYITVVVDNTYSMTGQQNNTPNPSGILIYQMGSAITIDGQPIQGVIPEVGAWVPVVAALGLMGWRRRPKIFRSRSESS